ncbi:MAG: PspC domain-containing protein [Caldilineaceae bacterium]
MKAPMVNVNNVEEIWRAGKKRMLYRHPTNKMIGGVCGGLADFTGIDPTFVRLACDDHHHQRWRCAGLRGALMLLPVGTVAAGQVVFGGHLAQREECDPRAAYVLIKFMLWLLSNIGILGSLWGAFWTVATIFFWPALLIGAGVLVLRRQP